MSRPCGWCTSPRRAEFERRVLDGDPIRLVSQDIGYSEAACYRHFRNHLRPELIRTLKSSEAGLDPSYFANRLVQLLRDADDVKAFARQVGDGRLLLTAGGQERETLSVLLTRLGVESTEVLDSMHEAYALVRSVRTVMPDHPEALHALTEHLRTEPDGSELADALDEVLRPTRRELAPPERSTTTTERRSA